MARRSVSSTRSTSTTAACAASPATAAGWCIAWTARSASTAASTTAPTGTSSSSTASSPTRRCSSRATASRSIVELGLELRDPVVIRNAPDPAVFNAEGRADLRPGKTVRLITTSWSDNPRKGADVIAELERQLDPARLRADVRRALARRVRARAHRPAGAVGGGGPAAPRASRLRLLRASTRRARTRCSRRLRAGCRRLSVDSGSNAEVVGGGGLAFATRPKPPLAWTSSSTAGPSCKPPSACPRSPRPRIATSRCCARERAGTSSGRVASPLRRWAIEARTKAWRDHSRLFVAGDGNDWSIAEDARQIARVAARLGAQVAQRELGVGRPRPVRLPREPVHAARSAARAQRQPARRRLPPRPPRNAGDAGVRHVLRGRAHTACGARPDSGSLAGDAGARAGGRRAGGEGVPHSHRDRPRALHARARPQSGPRPVRSSVSRRSAFVVGSFQKDGVGWEEGLEPKLIKGPDVLLAAVERLRQRVPELWLLLTAPARGYVKEGLERIGVPYRHLVAGGAGRRREGVPCARRLSRHLARQRAGRRRRWRRWRRAFRW